MSSLSDQLLKAGLVTQEQVKKATEKPKFKPKRAVAKKTNKKVRNEQSDLAKFYGERKQQENKENKEKQEEAHKKKETARLKKEMNEKTNKLISDNLLNDEAAEIRFNFVVGTSIKYLFVTKEQQQGLIDGKLAITFLASKRSLIPVEIGEAILKINPKKIVIIPASI